jgi:uracil-DNA glycosylase
VLLVGEAPGYKGCRITWIPFTSGRVFQDVAHPMLQELRTKITLPAITGESTATIVWNYLAEKEKTPFFWNSFPFHPHCTDNPASNRAPTNTEIEFGSQILTDTVEMYKPDLIAGIGHKGIKAIKHTFPTQAF